MTHKSIASACADTSALLLSVPGRPLRTPGTCATWMGGRWRRALQYVGISAVLQSQNVSEVYHHPKPRLQAEMAAARTRSAQSRLQESNAEELTRSRNDCYISTDSIRKCASALVSIPAGPIFREDA